MFAVCIIAVAAVCICIILCIILYHQMLLVNEVNKRLLLFAEDSIKEERTTKEQLQDSLVQLAIATENNSNRDSVTTQQYSIPQEEDDEITFFSDNNF